MITISKLRQRKTSNLRDSTRPSPYARPIGFLKRIFRVKSLFLWIVIVPNFFSILYFGFIESPIYISESKFIIRQADKKGQTGLSALLQSAGITTSREDVFTLKEFMLSRNALKTIDDNLNLRRKYSSDQIDPLNRFNPSGFDDSFEAFYEFYQNRIVTIDIDNTSSIITVKVKAFTPTLAHAINTALMFLGEGFVNDLNERARQDLINFSTQEVEEVEVATKAASLALSDYRNSQTLFDPAQQSTMQLQQISKLQSDLVEVRGQLAQLRTFTSESPYIKALEKRSNELQKEINAAMGKVAGGTNSMAQKVTEYERLNIDREFLEKRLMVALTSLESARSEAQRQRLYLANIALPNTPDTTRFPERGFNILMTLCGSLLVYGCLCMLIIGTKEHQS